MKNKFRIIEESLNEFTKRERDIEEDTWNDVEDEDETIDDINIDTSDMINAEEIEVEDDEDLIVNNKLDVALTNELKILEPDRRIFLFKIKGDTKNILQGIPITKLKNNAFLFKLSDNKLKKIYLKDIILVEGRKTKNNRALTIND